MAELFDEYLPMAERLARVHAAKNRRGELDSYRTAAITALWQAEQKYDPDSDATFETFAFGKIRWAMVDVDRQLGWMPRNAIKNWPKWHGQRELPKHFRIYLDIPEQGRETAGPLEDVPAAVISELEVLVGEKRPEWEPYESFNIRRAWAMQSHKEHIRRVADWQPARRIAGRSFAAERHENAYHGRRDYAGE